MLATELRQLIQSTLTPLNLYSLDAEELLCATCAQESHLGFWRTQSPHGPARGLFMEEGEDFDDIFKNFLAYHSDLLLQVTALFSTSPPSVDELVNNDQAAIAICRIHYLRSSGSLPSDIEGIWTYYKQHYNTPLGAATHDQFIQNYNTYILGNT